MIQELMGRILDLVVLRETKVSFVQELLSIARDILFIPVRRQLVVFQTDRVSDHYLRVLHRALNQRPKGLPADVSVGSSQIRIKGTSSALTETRRVDPYVRQSK